ncbi:hypothetical protein A6A08_19245 [Nocardiopsis sp. TSRI0078]|uniref:hypothetical protein n=1 Tax=unclassified Nocardiopsis TaxID=2649073 RepID=UPI0009392125|nr:hypothetical protein [Nocardiopsis sp. TSRI0078]OKI22406.1 hypothetical protein A6A08_19245 [Nocardiopsis sp. TSRI0078]
MLQFSAALLSRALGPLIALFSSPRGRHSTVAGRRRRSTRVRRYVGPPPAPTAREAAKPLPRAPRLAPPSQTSRAEDIALVRPYFAAHERLRTARARIPGPRDPGPAPASAPASVPASDDVRREFARVQERAAALLRQWSAAPEGDLLSGPAPRFGVFRPAEHVKPAEPARPAGPSEWDELTSLTRTWLDQRQRQEVPA